MTTANLHNNENLPIVIKMAKLYIARQALKYKVFPRPDHIVCYETDGDDASQPKLFAITLVAYDKRNANQASIIATVIKEEFQSKGQAYLSKLFQQWKKSPSPGIEGAYDLEDYDDFFKKPKTIRK